MSDQKDEFGRKVETDKAGNVTGVRVGAKEVETESRSAAYLRQKKGSREEWPGQHAAEAKRLDEEDAKAAASASGITYGKSPVAIKPKQ